jgi:hypothetical protein
MHLEMNTYSNNPDYLGKNSALIHGSFQQCLLAFHFHLRLLFFEIQLSFIVVFIYVMIVMPVFFLIRNNGFVNIHSIHSFPPYLGVLCILIILLDNNNICGNFNKNPARTIKSGPIDFNFVVLYFH